MYLRMRDDSLYNDDYHAQLAKLYEAQNRAAQTYTSQVLYLKHKMYSCNAEARQRCAEEAEKEWLRLDAEIDALNSAEYQRRQALKGIH